MKEPEENNAGVLIDADNVNVSFRIEAKLFRQTAQNF